MYKSVGVLQIYQNMQPNMIIRAVKMDIAENAINENSFTKGGAINLQLKSSD